jgi:hypothetical protein
VKFKTPAIFVLLSFAATVAMASDALLARRRRAIDTVAKTVNDFKQGDKK